MIDRATLNENDLTTNIEPKTPSLRVVTDLMPNRSCETKPRPKKIIAHAIKASITTKLPHREDLNTLFRHMHNMSSARTMIPPPEDHSDLELNTYDRILGHTIPNDLKL